MRAAKRSFSPLVKSLKLLAGGAWKHARGCKKSIEDCAKCQANIRWFTSLAPGVLSDVLLEDGRKIS